MSEQFSLPKKHFDKQWFIDELKSLLTTTLAFVAVDGVGILTEIYQGKIDREVLLLLGLLVARSWVKALLTLLFPTVFKKK